RLSQHGQEPRHPDFGRYLPGWMLWIGHLEEVEEERRCLAGGQVETSVALGDLLPGGRRRVGLGDPEVISEELQDRRQWHTLAVGHPARPADRDRPFDGAPGEFLAQAALANAGLANNSDHLPASSGFDARQEGSEGLEPAGP